jgi:hypothetical protein
MCELRPQKLLWFRRLVDPPLCRVLDRLPRLGGVTAGCWESGGVGAWAAARARLPAAARNLISASRHCKFAYLKDFRPSAMQICSYVKPLYSFLLEEAMARQRPLHLPDRSGGTNRE